MKSIINSPEKIVIRMEANNTLANALRRSVEEVSTLAIDEVEIVKNDSALYDEFLAHRLGLVPIKTDSRVGSGSKTEVKFKLKKSGPCTVYSDDLKGTTKVAVEGIPLTILEKGQEIELTATARPGAGVEHAKYIPGLCYYRHLFEINSSPKIDKIIEDIKKPVINPEKKGGKWITDIPEASIDEILKTEKNSVKESDEILFFIESWGQFDAQVILKKAVEILKDNLSQMEKGIK